MPFEENRIQIPHNVIMQNRSKLTVSGVKDIESFDEREIVIYTVNGTLTVSGNELRIEKLSVDEGELAVEGNINSLVYSESASKGGFFQKLFG